jgi:hypothetical protein
MTKTKQNNLLILPDEKNQEKIKFLLRIFTRKYKRYNKPQTT